MKLFRFSLWCVLVFVYFAVVVPAGSIKVGSTAPKISVRDLDGKFFYLSDFAGPACPPAKRRPVVVHFFGVHCPPCDKELPALRRVMESPAGKKVVWIFVDVMEPIEDVIAYRDKMKLPVLFLHDKYGVAAQDWGVSEKKGATETVILPYTFLLDRQGIIRAIFRGAQKNIGVLLLARINRLR